MRAYVQREKARLNTLLLIDDDSTPASQTLLPTQPLLAVIPAPSSMTIPSSYPTQHSSPSTPSHSSPTPTPSPPTPTPAFPTLTPAFPTPTPASPTPNPSSPSTPPSPVQPAYSPIPSPSRTPPTPDYPEETYEDPIFSADDIIKLSPIHEVPKKEMKPAVFRTVSTRAKTMPPRNKFEGLEWKDLEKLLLDLYPMYLPGTGVCYPGVISTKNFDTAAAYENIKLLREINMKKSNRSHHINKWIQKINSSILDCLSSTSDDDDNEFEIEIDEFK